MREMNCDQCGGPMQPVHHRRVMAEVDIDDLTEGQLADYLAAQESNCLDEWAGIEITYKCPKCKYVVIEQYI